MRDLRSPRHARCLHCPAFLSGWQRRNLTRQNGMLPVIQLVTIQIPVPPRGLYGMLVHFHENVCYPRLQQQQHETHDHDYGTLHGCFHRGTPILWDIHDLSSHNNGITVANTNIPFTTNRMQQHSDPFSKGYSWRKGYNSDSGVPLRFTFLHSILPPAPLLRPRIDLCNK